MNKLKQPVVKSRYTRKFVKLSLVLVVVLSALSFLALYFYGNESSNRSFFSSTESPKQDSDRSIDEINYDKTGTTEQAKIKQQIFRFYTEWNKAAKNGEPDSETALKQWQHFLTGNGKNLVLSQSRDYEIFTCSNVILRSIKIEQPDVDDGYSRVLVTPFELGGGERDPIVLELTKQGDTWLIDNVICTS